MTVSFKLDARFFTSSCLFGVFQGQHLNLECIAEAFDTPLQHFEKDMRIVDWGGRHHHTCFVHVGPSVCV